MVRIIKESALSRPEIADMLVVAGFGNEEEGYLDYFLEYNPKYVASVNLDDMGAYIDDLNTGEHIPLPFANGADRMILRTKEDVRAFLDYIYDLDYDDIFESVKTNRRNKRQMKEDIEDDAMLLGRLIADCKYFLGNGNGYEKHLWAGNVEDQIEKMWELYDKLGDRQDMITADEIEEYEERMLNVRDDFGLKEFIGTGMESVLLYLERKGFEIVKEGNGYIDVQNNKTRTKIRLVCKDGYTNTRSSLLDRFYILTK